MKNQNLIEMRKGDKVIHLKSEIMCKPFEKKGYTYTSENKRSHIQNLPKIEPVVHVSDEPIEQDGRKNRKKTEE